jgi:predicted DNA-binding transcriptional regulator AlpA
MTELEPMLTTADIAEHLRMNPIVVARKASQGSGDVPPARKIGRKFLFARDEVDAWLAAQPHTSDSRPRSRARH